MCVSVGGLCVHDMFVQECINLLWVIVRHTQMYRPVVRARCLSIPPCFMIINAKVIIQKTFLKNSIKRLFPKWGQSTVLFEDEAICFHCFISGYIFLCIRWCGCIVHLWIRLVLIVKKNEMEQNKKCQILHIWSATWYYPGICHCPFCL